LSGLIEQAAVFEGGRSEAVLCVYYRNGVIERDTGGRFIEALQEGGQLHGGIG